MADQHIPQSMEELTADWFTEVLGEQYNAEVTEVKHAIIGEGIGFVGELIRCSLTWSSNDNNPPASVIAKVPSRIDANRGMGEALQGYEREIAVYQNFAGSYGLPMPEFYYGAFDPNPAKWMDNVLLFILKYFPISWLAWILQKFVDSAGVSARRYLLIMEDIDDARPPTQAVGGSIDDALACLEVLARFHAHNWMSVASLDKEELLWSIGRGSRVWNALYYANRSRFVTDFGALLGDEGIAKLDQIQADLLPIIDRLTAAPWTVLHGDYRLDNVLFRADDSMVVVDYQLCGFGRAGWDVTYFITTALEPEHSDEEERMLRHYHQSLVAAGVEDYSWEMLIQDCEDSKTILAHRMACTSDIDTTVDGQDDDFIEILIKRVMGWAHIYPK